MMGTRCGTLDPGVVLHLQSQLGMSLAEVEQLLYRQSGLLGVSGISSDMRVLSADGSIAAQEAIELFIWRAVREIGAMTASLGGIDGLVFTAGIGENHMEVRGRICGQLEWLGVRLDADANAQGRQFISAADSRVKILVIPTNEEQMIAHHTITVLAKSEKACPRD